MEYSINDVFDANSGEMYDATVVFKHNGDAHEFRRNYFATNQVLKCICCEKRATIGTRNNQPFFKHYPNTGHCDLKLKGFTPIERDQISRHYASKESARHKELKHAIGAYLSSTIGVNPDSIQVDNKFLTDQNEKRKPDVLCNFEAKQLAFEIQLSNLPPRFIFQRHDFYKRKGIYLMWVLDNVNVKNQNQNAKDIKYLNSHQNFFFFRNKPQEETFIVEYKQGEINHRNECSYRWTANAINLHQLTFDQEEFQVYYSSLEDEQDATELEAFKSKHKNTLDILRGFYKTDHERYIPVANHALTRLENRDIKLLQRAMSLTGSNDLLLKAAREGKGQFIRYLLESRDFDINPNGNENGKPSILEQVLTAEKLLFRWHIVFLLFNLNYQVTDRDIHFLKTFRFHQDIESERQKMFVKILVFNRVKNQHERENYSQIEGAVLVILSAKFKKIIGYQLNNFISLANTAVTYYKPTFSFIEQALKHYQVWDLIQGEDHKKTFKAKHEAFLADQKVVHNEIGLMTLRTLFPEVAGKDEDDWIKPQWLV